MHGVGTQSSPITIDDSEDEICYELIKPPPAQSPQFPSNQALGISHPPDPRLIIAASGHGPRPHNGRQSMNLDAQSLKRRRSSSPDGQRPIKQARSLENRLSNPAPVPVQQQPAPITKSKKQKNKEGKLKRQQQQQEAAEKKRQQQLQNLAVLRNAPGLEPQFPPGHVEGTSISPFLLLPFNQTPEIMRAMGYPYTPSQADGAYQVPPPALIHGDPSLNWSQYPMGWPAQPPHLSNSLPFSPPPPDLAPPPLPPRNPPTQAPRASLPLPPKPPTHPPVPIGMEPDQDPNSKHGIFHLSEDGYTPNPARTLVMEQLPKNWRSHDVLHSWGRNATGHSNPIVKVLVDSKLSRALLEFATAELARKAWESPRLGTQYAGLKSHQLKGKPREDLLRVWWYRVSGVGAREGVGEIEEGEIEDGPGPSHEDTSGGLKTSPIDPADQLPKETKKQRKARLNRERQQKLHLDYLAKLQAAPATFGVESRNQMVAQGSNAHTLPSRPILEVVSHVPPVAIADEGMDVDKPDDEDMELASPTQSDTAAPPPAFNDIRVPITTTRATIIAKPHALTPIFEGVIPPAKPSTSMQKVELEARGRLLQGQIARAKLDLAERQNSASVTQPLSVASTESVPDSKRAELELRERVLKSKRAKQAVAAAAVAAKPDTPAPTPEVSEGDASKPGPVPDTVLEDLAVSFIEQAVEAAKAPASTIPELAPVPVINKAPMRNKTELERLEQHIARTKALMQQWNQAKTKQERDVLKAQLNELERQRSADEEATLPTVPPVSTRPVEPKHPRVQSLSFWPKMANEQHVLLLSDDDSDEEHSDDD